MHRTADPVAVDVDTHLTGTYPDELLEQAVRCFFGLTPAGMIRTLQLDQPIFADAATMATLPGQACRGSRPGRPGSLRSCVQNWSAEMMAAETYSILFLGKDSIATILLALRYREPLDEAVYCEVMFDQPYRPARWPEHRDFIYGTAIPALERMA